MIRVRLKPSRLLAATLTLVHFGAAATVIPLHVRIEAKATLLALVLAGLVYTLRRYALLSSTRSITELEIHDRERAAVRPRVSEWSEACILCTSCVTPALTVLNLRLEGERFARHVLLVRDNVSGEDFRRIRVLLRWARPKAIEPGKPASDPTEVAG